MKRRVVILLFFMMFSMCTIGRCDTASTIEMSKFEIGPFEVPVPVQWECSASTFDGTTTFYFYPPGHQSVRDGELYFRVVTTRKDDALYITDRIISAANSASDFTLCKIGGSQAIIYDQTSGSDTRQLPAYTLVCCSNRYVLILNCTGNPTNSEDNRAFFDSIIDNIVIDMTNLKNAYAGAIHSLLDLDPFNVMVPATWGYATSDTSDIVNRFYYDPDDESNSTYIRVAVMTDSVEYQSDYARDVGFADFFADVGITDARKSVAYYDSIPAVLWYGNMPTGSKKVTQCGIIMFHKKSALVITYNNPDPIKCAEQIEYIASTITIDGITFDNVIVNPIPLP